MTRRHEHLLDRRMPGQPGAEHVARFAAGKLPRSVNEALRHARLEQAFQQCAPGQVEALLLHRQFVEAETH